MIGGSLFQRLFARFLAGVAIAFAVLLGLFQVYRVRVVDAEWREELRQEALWLARHTSLRTSGVLASAWRTMHDSVRVTFFTAGGELVADSHPEREAIDLAAVQAGGEPPGQLAVVETLVAGDGVVVMSRPYVPTFPSGMRWELGLAVALILGPLVLLLYPLVRSMSSTLHGMGSMAREVASGHFGKTLPVERSDELGDLVRSLNEMSEHLAEAERVNSRLLHDVSHELRSPLGRIQVLVETMALRPEEKEACVHGIEQEIRLLDRLVGDLLQVARLESDQRNGRHETFSLQHWAGETLPRLERSARAAGIRWMARLPARDAEVSGDAQHLALALANLVDNAIHALRDRADAAIEVDVAIDGATWTMSVADNGPGVPDKHLAHVFRRFYRVDEHRARESGGVGLGLSLVRAIAEAHGGGATIESAAGRGTRVTMSLALGVAGTPWDWRSGSLGLL